MKFKLSLKSYQFYLTHIICDPVTILRLLFEEQGWGTWGNLNIFKCYQMIKKIKCQLVCSCVNSLKVKVCQVQMASLTISSDNINPSPAMLTLLTILYTNS